VLVSECAIHKLSFLIKCQKFIYITFNFISKFNILVNYFSKCSNNMNSDLCLKTINIYYYMQCHATLFYVENK